jgi:hypothetical protein
VPAARVDRLLLANAILVTGLARRSFVRYV